MLVQTGLGIKKFAKCLQTLQQNIFERYKICSNALQSICEHFQKCLRTLKQSICEVSYLNSVDKRKKAGAAFSWFGIIIFIIPFTFFS